MDFTQAIAAMIEKINGYGTAVKTMFTDLGLKKSATMGSVDATNQIGGYQGINMTATKGILRDNGTTHSFYRGASVNAELWSCDNAGNFTAKGDVANASDSRLKKDWSIPDYTLVVKELSQVARYGTYTRIDTDHQQLGVAADDLLDTTLGKAVTMSEGNEKFLALSYGQAALVGTISLAKAHMALEERVRELEKRLGVTY
jgi:hypothetical protein